MAENRTTNTKTPPTPPDEPKLQSLSPRLTPSEIESLRKHKKLVSTYARGKFADLFKK